MEMNMATLIRQLKDVAIHLPSIKMSRLDMTSKNGWIYIDPRNNQQEMAMPLCVLNGGIFHKIVSFVCDYET